MIWFRAGLLAIVVGVIVVAFNAATAPPSPTVAPSEPLAPLPTARPTRVPLPTLGPEMVISRISRATPVPRPAPTQSTSPWVDIVEYGYSPAQMQTQLGATIAWSNSGAEGHDVRGTGPGGEWTSGPLAPGERYAHQFALPGTYDYVCDVHPEMRGRVLVVQP